MLSGKTVRAWLAIGALFLGTPAAALESNTATSVFGSARLVSAVDGTGDLDAIPLGLHLTLPDGWKTYWRSPGDAGLPARIDWAGSENLTEATIRWPIAERFSLFGLETFGYEREVVLPIVATPTRRGEDMLIEAVVDYLVCKDICVPVTAELKLGLPAGPARPSAHAHLIDRFNVRVPSALTAMGLSVESAGLARDGDKARLLVTARADPPFAKPDLLVEGAEGVAFGKPKIERHDGGREIRISMPVFTPKDLPPGERPLMFTLTDGDRALEVSRVPAAVAGSSGVATLALMLLTAVLGGLILNLMPCVLPVLSLKLFGLAQHGGAGAGPTRRAFLASAAGILVSFALLASAAVALKLAGHAVGWGLQFQQPLFLVFMIAVLTLFAANLWGWLEIALPSRLSNALGTGSGGHFLTGMLATLLATPCSAPFLGTAIAFALSRGPAEIYAIFLALGLGLALPYLLIAAAPGLATRLPRPGAWMLRLRQVLGLALAGTALWLLWVLSAETGLRGALVVGALMALAVLVLALLPRARLAVTGLVIAAFLTPSVFGGAPAAVAEHAVWRAFDRAAIPRLVAEGKTVFVDVTADWCLTCQVNKRLVLNQTAIASRLDAADVVALKADWTRPDPAISDYLASHGRYGIPFNVVYGPGRPQGVVLPELLTSAAVIEAMDAAGRR